MFDPEITESAAREAWLLQGRPRTGTYVAEFDGVVVGTAILKPNQPGLGDHVANAAWMIDPDQSGKGVGRRFAEFVIEQAIELGFCGMQFNAVVATNTRAIRLWESLGFEIVGTVPAAFRHQDEGRVAIHVMHRSLG